MNQNLEKLNKISNEIVKYQTDNIDIFKGINQMHEGLAILDEKGIYKYMNKAHETIFGYDESELIGKSWETIYDKDEIVRIKTEIFTVLDEKGKWSGEAIAKDKNGNLIYEYLYLSKLKKEGIICICSNITNEILKWDNIFNKLPIAICIANTKGYFKKVNQLFAQLLGYKIEELENLSFISLVHPDDVYSTYFEIGRLSTNHKTEGYINRFRTKNGEYISIKWNSVVDSNLDIFATAEIYNN